MTSFHIRIRKKKINAWTSLNGIGFGVWHVYLISLMPCSLRFQLVSLFILITPSESFGNFGEPFITHLFE